MSSSEFRHKAVYVRPYTRWRFEKLEYVTDHYRSLPGQLELFH